MHDFLEMQDFGVSRESPRKFPEKSMVHSQSSLLTRAAVGAKNTNRPHGKKFGA
jgi:hypothetical protein